jgi:hypothetical protein
MIVLVFCGFKIVETVTSNVYYVAFRPAYSRNLPHDAVRSLILSLIGIVEVNLLFATVWLLIGGFCEPIDGMVDAIYFSAVTFQTVGFGEIHPTDDRSKGVVILMIAVSMLMNAVVVARAVGLIVEKRAE